MIQSSRRSRVNSDDVARKAGVSRTTVSYVLNGRQAGIPQATRERVLLAAAELGYRPDPAASSLAGGKTYVISLMTLCIHPAFYSRVIESFLLIMANTPYEIRITETRKWSAQHWEKAALGGWSCDGIIVLNETEHLDLLRSACEGRVPIVSVGGFYSLVLDHVGVDYYAGALLAVRHLIESGRRKIVHLTSERHAVTERYRAYAEELAKAGLPAQTITFEQAPGELTNRASAYRAMTEYLARTPAVDRCDALFCVDDESAIAALRALRDVDLHTPGDVAVVGCDDIEDSSYFYPAITTIRFPYDEVASQSWQMLLRRMEQPELPRQELVYRPELIVRESSIGMSRNGREA